MTLPLVITSMLPLSALLFDVPPEDPTGPLEDPIVWAMIGGGVLFMLVVLGFVLYSVKRNKGRGRERQ